MKAWLSRFVPAPLAVGPAERIRAALGAVAGIALAGWLSRLFVDVGGLQSAWLVAPLGASAVLVFAVPASPLAQPWSVVAGNTVSALVGIACVRWLGLNPWSAGLAVGLAIAAMMALRCLHPPGGAAALLVVLTGVTDPKFAVFPVLINAVLLVAVALVYNTVTGHSYPHRAAPPLPQPAASLATLNAELDQVLRRHTEILDISRDDLRALFEELTVLHEDSPEQPALEN